MNTRPWWKIVAFELAVLALIGLGIVGLIRGASYADGTTSVLDVAVTGDFRD